MRTPDPLETLIAFSQKSVYQCRHERSSDGNNLRKRYVYRLDPVARFFKPHAEGRSARAKQRQGRWEKRVVT